VQEDILKSRLQMRKSNEYAASLMIAFSTIILGCAAFYVFFKRHYLLMWTWLMAAWSFVNATLTVICLAYWAAARQASLDPTYNADMGYAIRLPYISILFTLSVMICVSLVLGVLMVRFVRRITATLALDIEACVDKHMEYILDAE
jgi:hypothetical protein